MRYHSKVQLPHQIHMYAKYTNSSCNFLTRGLWITKFEHCLCFHAYTNQLQVRDTLIVYYHNQIQ